MITPQDMLEWLGEQFPENIGMMPRDRMIAESIRDFIATHSWQPIETAPKDGTIIDVWLADASQEDVEFYCTEGTRYSSEWSWLNGKFRPTMGLTQIPVFVEPTHWMPLHAAPQPPEDVK